MPQETIETCWQNYRHRRVPIRTSPTQIEEMRLAFYSGAVALLDLLAVGADKAEISCMLAVELRGHHQRARHSSEHNRPLL